MEMVPTIKGSSPGRAERSEAREKILSAKNFKEIKKKTRRALARRVARAMTREARHVNSFN